MAEQLLMKTSILFTGSLAQFLKFFAKHCHYNTWLSLLGNWSKAISAQVNSINLKS